MRPRAEAGGLSVPEMPHAYCEPTRGGAGMDTQRNISFPDGHSLSEVGCGRQVENVWWCLLLPQKLEKFIDL